MDASTPYSSWCRARPRAAATDLHFRLILVTPGNRDDSETQEVPRGIARAATDSVVLHCFVSRRRCMRWVRHLIWGLYTAYNGRNRDLGRIRFLEIGVSLASYCEVFGHLPYSVRREFPGETIETGSPNGTGPPLYSWRVEIVPFLMSWHGRWNKAQPWNHPVNSALSELSGVFYAYWQL